MEQERLKDKIRGCLMAGAAGDALGYEVEFMSRKAIISRYGENEMDKYETQLRYAAQADDKAAMYLRWAADALRKQ